MSTVQKAGGVALLTVGFVQSMVSAKKHIDEICRQIKTIGNKFTRETLASKSKASDNDRLAATAFKDITDTYYEKLKPEWESDLSKFNS